MTGSAGRPFPLNRTFLPPGPGRPPGQASQEGQCGLPFDLCQQLGWSLSGNYSSSPKVLSQTHRRVRVSGTLAWSPALWREQRLEDTVSQAWPLVKQDAAGAAGRRARGGTGVATPCCSGPRPPGGASQPTGPRRLSRGCCSQTLLEPRSPTRSPGHPAGPQEPGWGPPCAHPSTACFRPACSVHFLSPASWQHTVAGLE